MSRLADYFAVVGYDYEKDRKGVQFLFLVFRESRSRVERQRKSRD